MCFFGNPDSIAEVGGNGVKAGQEANVTQVAPADVAADDRLTRLSNGGPKPVGLDDTSFASHWAPGIFATQEARSFGIDQLRGSGMDFSNAPFIGVGKNPLDNSKYYASTKSGGLNNQVTTAGPIQRVRYTSASTAPGLIPQIGGGK